MSNIGTYTSLGDAYTQDEIQEAVEDLGYVPHGHRSGGTGSGVSSQTEKEMGELTDILRANKAKKKAAKKKTAPRGQAPMSDFGKAMAMALKIFEEQGKDGLGDFLEYMNNRGYDVSMPEEAQDELMAIFT